MIKSITITNKIKQLNKLKWETLQLSTSRINLLFGLNGTGKSKLLEYINKNENIKIDGDIDKIFYYSGRELNQKYAGYFIDYNIDSIQSIWTSEGESSLITFGKFIKLCSIEINKYNNPIVIIDEFDSGLTPNSIMLCMSNICNILDLNKNVQIIVACNSYDPIYIDMCNSIWLSTGEIITFKNHNDFVSKYIIEQDNYLKTLKETENNTPKISKHKTSAKYKKKEKLCQ